MVKRITTEDWVKRAKSLHGDQYDYHLVEYVTAKINVNVICSKHGEWLCNPDSHISKGTGCPKCGGSQKKTTSEFVDKAKLVHGENYDYSFVSYTNAHTNIKIVCTKHGSFKQSPTAHLSGQGCPKCGQDLITNKLKLNINELNKRLYEKSNGMVTVDSETYIAANKAANFICKKHGEFRRLANSVIYGKHPCLACAKEQGFYLDHTTESFTQVLHSKFGCRYEIKEFIYRGKKTPIILICTEHGEFSIQAATAYKSSGCPVCSRLASQESRNIGLKKKNENTKQKRLYEWLNKVHKFHGDFYDYSLVEYDSARKYVTIICPIHGLFKQTPSSHQHSGCKKCANENLKGRYTDKYFIDFPERKSRPAILYYIKFWMGQESFFKIGITTTSISERFAMVRAAGIQYKILGERHATLFEAFTFETKIQSIHGKKYRYRPQLKEVSNRAVRIGPSECFSQNLDEEYYQTYFE